MLNNYDKIANYYDLLSRLIFFKAQVKAQINQLKHIASGSSILIVGGGTGWILEEIAKIHSDGLHIVYVELSEKMISLSQKRNYGANDVEFINVGIEDFNSSVKFDVILTPFLFDNFSEDRAKKVFKKLDVLLKDNGLWLMVDFSLNGERGKWWKWVLLKSMYHFFKLIGIVEVTNLIDIEPYFLNARYQKIEEKLYYGSFIKADIYKKKADF